MIYLKPVPGGNGRKVLDHDWPDPEPADPRQAQRLRQIHENGGCLVQSCGALRCSIRLLAQWGHTRYAHKGELECDGCRPEPNLPACSAVPRSPDQNTQEQ